MKGSKLSIKGNSSILNNLDKKDEPRYSKEEKYISGEVEFMNEDEDEEDDKEARTSVKERRADLEKEYFKAYMTKLF